MGFDLGEQVDLWSLPVPADSRVMAVLFREVNVGYASGIMVLAVTNTGEPGYSLYIPSEFALQIYDNLMKVFLEILLKYLYCIFRWCVKITGVNARWKEI